MAELTKLEAKLGEVTGLAMAAQAATKKVETLEGVGDEHVRRLQEMRAQAEETENRCTELAGTFDGKKTAILEEASATKAKGAKMMGIYLDADAEALDGFEFLTMAEAGEVGHWKVLRTLASSGSYAEVSQLASWAIPIQERHLELVQRTSDELAADESPDDPA